MKNIYISGTSSGLGKFLLKKIKNSKKFHRNKKNNINKDSILIHSAFFKKKINENKKDFELNYQQTLDLYNKIEKHCFKTIVFISTIDIYQKNISKNSYIVLKKKLETKIKKKKNFYIFRCGFLIGKSMKKNSIYKLIRAKSKSNISLSEKSSVYLTSYEDVLNGVRKIIKQKNIINGIYNLISKKKFHLNTFKNKNIVFGKYKLSYKEISNAKYEKNFNLKTKRINKIIKEVEKI